MIRNLLSPRSLVAKFISFYPTTSTYCITNSSFGSRLNRYGSSALEDRFHLILISVRRCSTNPVMPLLYWPRPDKLIWHYSKNGAYPAISLANSSIFKGNWQRLWGLSIPNKIRVFVWRCVHNGLFTGEALHMRLQLSPSCPFCAAVETLEHMLLHCSRIHLIWFGSPLSFRSHWDLTTKFHLQWKHISNQLTSLDPTASSLELFCFILWHIWKSRNNCIFQNAQDSPEWVISQSIRDRAEFDQAQQEQRSLVLRRQPPPQQHYNVHVIPSYCLKINYDAAVDTQKQQGCVGLMAKNADNVILGRFSALFRFIWDPGILEFLALRETMNWAISNDWNNVIFEGDALQVSTMINSRCCTLASAQGICDDI
ncbi:uncharacterized protein LOC126687507 [Mercurialis annua]|uniref:uncharacterized protein LOC126687507 n=1 Tax=Mercurialis annua TaxID=3986 RepID=UPI002160FBAA|nr:uncharacterized protein LOC126687507 [Mercurialis annua]